MSAYRISVFVCDTCGRKKESPTNYDLPDVWEHRNPANEQSEHVCLYCQAREGYEDMSEAEMEEARKLRDDMEGTIADGDLSEDRKIQEEFEEAIEDTVNKMSDEELEEAIGYASPEGKEPSDFASGPKDEWDRKMKEDYEDGGPLKQMAEEAREDYEEGRTTPLPGTEDRTGGHPDHGTERVIVQSQSRELIEKVAKAARIIADSHGIDAAIKKQTFISSETLSVIEEFFPDGDE